MRHPTRISIRIRKGILVGLFRKGCPGDDSRITYQSVYYAENLGSTSCNTCPAGHRCYYVHKARVNCLKGQYQDDTGQRFCESCNRGEHSLQSGRTTKCDICGAGSRCYYVNIYSTSKLCVRKDNIKTKLDKDFANRRREGNLTLKLPDQQNATFSLLVITVIQST